MKSEAMWDRLASDWDKPGASLSQSDSRLLERAKKHLNASAAVLDYGCATGTIALELASSVNTVSAIDISSKMIAVARRRAGERALTNTHFMHATIFDEQFNEEAFDAILAFSILHLVENPSAVVQRIHQLLKPGGIFIASTPCLGEKTVVSVLLNLPIFLLSKIGVLPRISFFSAAGLAAVMTNAQFQIVETEFLSVRPITEYFIVARKL
ncbi:MAG: methyltransferase domain-containing protein [Anaerolineae bacterium]|nr:methyltransferase domain-containing protein [Anaerolineae bacterium]